MKERRLMRAAWYNWGTEVTGSQGAWSTADGDFLLVRTHPDRRQWRVLLPPRNRQQSRQGYAWLQCSGLLHARFPSRHAAWEELQRLRGTKASASRYVDG